MRHAFSMLFVVLIAALTSCAVIAKRSRKPIGSAVALLETSLIPPVFGNLLIIGSSRRAFALAGCYTYYLGMDLVMLALSWFTASYCKGDGKG